MDSGLHSTPEVVTRVIGINEAPGRDACQDPYIYIGRRTARNPGYFGNPFSVYDAGEDGKPIGRDVAIAKFRKYMEERLLADPEYAAQVRGLHGKILVCYCKTKKDPSIPCHGDVLAHYADFLVYHWHVLEASWVARDEKEARFQGEAAHERYEQQRREWVRVETQRNLQAQIAQQHTHEIHDLESFRVWRRTYLDRALGHERGGNAEKEPGR